MDLTTPARDLSEDALEARYAYLAGQSMRDFDDTLPSDYTPIAAHAAGALDDEDKCQHGEGSGIVLWPMAMVCVGAAVSFLAWIAR